MGSLHDVYKKKVAKYNDFVKFGWRHVPSLSPGGRPPVVHPVIFATTGAIHMQSLKAIKDLFHFDDREDAEHGEKAKLVNTFLRKM